MGRAGGSGNRKVRRGPRRFTISMQKRLVVVFLMVLTAFILLAFRLILIQRDNGRTYTMQVLSQQEYNNKSLPYKRGRITDAKGTVLADSQLVYNVIIDASQIMEKDEDYDTGIVQNEENLNQNLNRLYSAVTALQGENDTLKATIASLRTRLGDK